MVTPICPHLLLKVPLVLHPQGPDSLSVANSRNGIRISVDGMMDQEFTKTYGPQIYESEKVLKLVRFSKNYFYKNLFTKMMGND
jgi:NAD+ kinase